MIKGLNNLFDHRTTNQKSEHKTEQHIVVTSSTIILTAIKGTIYYIQGFKKGQINNSTTESNSHQKPFSAPLHTQHHNNIHIQNASF